MVHLKTKTNLIYFIFLLITYSSFGQSIQKDQIDIDLQTCLELEENDSYQSECFMTAIIKWEFKLNRTYNKLIKYLKPEQQNLIIESQKQWVNYKNSEVEFSNQFYTNSKENIKYPKAYRTNLDIIRQRAIELETYINNLQLDKP